MNEPENVRSAVEVIASHPKVATAVAVANTSLGAYASTLEIWQGWLGFISLSIGCLTGLVVLAYQVIRLVRFWRQEEA